jgi:DNA (cytosine-5)-methyltransferase 1
MAGAGGCGRGYKLAGFHVTGIDLNSPSEYGGDDFIQGDVFALDPDWIAENFDAVHASPHCQRYSQVTGWRGDPLSHPDQVGPVRDLLNATGLSWVIENVDGAPLVADFMLCGTMFGLPLRRHRYFETNWAGVETWGKLSPCGHHPDDYSFDHGGKQPESVYRDAMGCEWMTVIESRQAIPPAYTRFIGEQLTSQLDKSPEQLPEREATRRGSQ